MSTIFQQQLSFLKQSDEQLFRLIEQEWERQEEGLELIASENNTSLAVMNAQGSLLTNKYAEGLPGKRYYGGCRFVDEVESLAIERVKKLFSCAYANVQPHSGSQANMAAYLAILNPGDKILGMNLSEGGHLTHGSPVNFSGKLFQVVSYGLDYQTERIDYQRLEDLILTERPKMVIAGASAYPREIDFASIRKMADRVGAFFVVDIAHIAGLVAAGLHQDPLLSAHIVTSTTHKTLRGPRGGIVLTNEADLAKKVDSMVFPGIQGGPLEHVIAAKAVAFHEALQPEFKTYQEQVVRNAKVLAEELLASGIQLVSGGTDNHLILVKTDSVQLSGKEAEKILEEVHMTCNKNMVPKDSRSPFVTSGIRLGTPAITTRGLKDSEVRDLGKWMAEVLQSPQDENIKKLVREKVMKLCKRFPVYPQLV